MTSTPRIVRSGARKADGMQVRHARPADWEALRELRLRALADAPDAFASTMEHANIQEGHRIVARRLAWRGSGRHKHNHPAHCH